MFEINIESINDFYDRFKTIFFEFYKQGFIASNYNRINFYQSKEQLKKFIQQDFKYFFDNNANNFLLQLQDGKRESPNELKTSDIIIENKSGPIIFPQPDIILVTCPLCDKKILSKEINFEKIDLSHILVYPFPYLYVHHSDGDAFPHALLIYFDAHFKVRGKKVIKFSNLNSK